MFDPRTSFPSGRSETVWMSIARSNFDFSARVTVSKIWTHRPAAVVTVFPSREISMSVIAAPSAVVLKIFHIK